MLDSLSRARHLGYRPIALVLLASSYGSVRRRWQRTRRGPGPDLAPSPLTLPLSVIVPAFDGQLVQHASQQRRRLGHLSLSHEFIRRAIRFVIAGKGLAAYLLGSGDDADRGADDTRNEQRTDDASDGGPGEDSSTEPDEPDSTGSDAPLPAPNPADVVDLADNVSADVPAVAPPGRDTRNKPVRYGPQNLFDNRPRTAWRMPGDGAGETLTFTLGQDAVLTEVGLINGYAKVDGPENWYQANRRIRAVQWEFDDGTRVTQTLNEQGALQVLAIDPVKTSTVRLHLLSVSQPAAGAKGRNYTAISEISLRGAPA